jgi:hypothetical protein
VIGGAVIGAVVASLATWFLISPTWHHRSTSERKRSTTAFRVAFDIERIAGGRPLPAAAAQRLRAGDAMYAQGKWKLARLAYEAGFADLNKTICGARPDDSACGLLVLYRADR